MGKIIGNKTVGVKIYTEEEVNVLTKELNEKIAELTAENVKVKDEFDAKDEVIKELNEKIVELTAENDVDSDEKSSNKKSKKDE